MAGTGFVDRVHAGRALAVALEAYEGTNAIVLGLPRGGVVVASAVADALGLPLRMMVVRKIGAPRNPELGIGAVSETGIRWLDYHLVQEVGASEDYILQEVAAQMAEAARRREQYGQELDPNELEGKTVVIVDDGIATGATALVGIQSARGLGAQTVVLATPVASPPAEALLTPYLDRFIALITPDPFLAVGLHYGNFDQVSDEEVMECLRRARSS